MKLAVLFVSLLGFNASALLKDCHATLNPEGGLGLNMQINIFADKIEIKADENYDANTAYAAFGKMVPEGETESYLGYQDQSLDPQTGFRFLVQPEMNQPKGKGKLFVRSLETSEGYVDSVYECEDPKTK